MEKYIIMLDGTMVCGNFAGPRDGNKNSNKKCCKYPGCFFLVIVFDDRLLLLTVVRVSSNIIRIDERELLHQVMKMTLYYTFLTFLRGFESVQSKQLILELAKHNIEVLNTKRFVSEVTHYVYI